MAYRERTIELTFPELGDDCSVTIRNPLLLPDDPEAWTALTGRERGYKRFARMILSWNVWDPDTDEALPAPTVDDPSSLERCPAAILRRLSEEYLRPLAPKPPTTNGATDPALVPLVAGTTTKS